MRTPSYVLHFLDRCLGVAHTARRRAVVFAVSAMLVGAAAEALGLEREYQANTIRKRRVLSLVYLGKEVMRSTNSAPVLLGPPCWLLLPISVARV